MERSRLGRTNIQVSVACLGTGGHSRLGLARGGTEDNALAVVRAALDRGVNFIDTAGTYGTEEVVGRAVSGRRDSVVISSKNHMVRDQAKFFENDYITGDEFALRVENSLRRLRSDYVDIMYVHGVVADQYDYCRAEIVPALQKLQEQGKVRQLAISERFTVEPQHQMLKWALKDGVFDVIMVGLNLVNQTAKQEILPLAVHSDVGVQCMYAVRGKLATTESARALVAEAIELGEVDRTEVDPDHPFDFLIESGAARSVVDACYRFARHTAGVDTVLTGTGSVAHLLDNLQSIESPPLPTEAIERLSRVFSRVQTVTAE